MLLLAIDVGNTQISLGVFRDSTLAATWRAATEHERTEDELAVFLDGFLSRDDISLRTERGHRQEHRGVPAVRPGVRLRGSGRRPGDAAAAGASGGENDRHRRARIDHGAADQEPGHARRRAHAPGSAPAVGAKSMSD